MDTDDLTEVRKGRDGGSMTPLCHFRSWNMSLKSLSGIGVVSPYSRNKYSVHLCLFAVFFLAVALSALADNIVPKEVQLTHPSVANPLERTIHQVRDVNGNVLEYYLDVRSVICGDEQCEIITVRLFWDELGGYLKYEFPQGGELTKRGHKKFTDADYEQLQKLLSNPESILEDIDSKDVVSPAESQEGEEVDGVSGATLISDRGGMVPGAVYTCYTLWHWAQSGVQQAIRDITAQDLSEPQLKQFLSSEDDVQALFAIQQVASRKRFDDLTKEQVRNAIHEGSDELIEDGLGYFERLGADEYYRAVELLFKDAGSEKRVLFLAALTAAKYDAPAGFYERLSVHLPNLKSYMEVHLFIGLLTSLDSVSEEVVENTKPLLESSNALIARKARNFISQQE